MRPPRSSCLVSQQKHRTLAERMRGRIRAPRKNSEEEEEEEEKKRANRRCPLVVGMSGDKTAH